MGKPTSGRPENYLSCPRRGAAGVDAWAFYRHIQRMIKLLSAASTTTATAYGGSPAGCAR